MANWLNQLQSLLGQQGRFSSSDDQPSGNNLLLPGALGGLAGLLVASKSSRKLLAKYGTGALLVGGGAVAGINISRRCAPARSRHRLMSRPHRRHLLHRPNSTPAANG